MTALAPNPTILRTRIRELIRSGRHAAARPLVSALRKIVPDCPDTAELDARVLQLEGRLGEAEAVTDRALASSPDFLSLLMCRAELRLQNGEVLGGADDAAAAVIAMPGCAPAKALLGVALIQLGRFDDAIVCLREAVSAAPRHPAFREALAQAFERSADSAAAVRVLAEGIDLTPASVELRVAAIMTALRRRDVAGAAGIAETARKVGVADARVFGLLGHSRSLLGENDAASQAYEEALKLAPEDPYVRYLVAASGALPSASRAPQAYIETVFDGYAGHFESHLLSLGYRIPGLFRTALLEHLPGLRDGRDTGPVLDLGCGTGLIGVVLSDLAITGLVGIDISSRMLDQARSKDVYSDLVCRDIEAALGTDPQATMAGPWEVIVAADSLCYFGDLAPVMRGAFRALREGGLLVLSVEELAEAQAARSDESGDSSRGPLSCGVPWRLGPLGRFAHRADYVADTAVAAGFVVRALRREVLRHDRGADIDGLIAVLARPA